VANNISQELASFAVDAKYEDLPAAVVDETKYLLLDSMGCAFSSITTDRGKMSIALAKRLGGPPESSIIGIGDKVSCSTAAYANGELINSTDYDALPPGRHSPPYIIPPSLSIAESIGVTGKDLILALALGFEIAARFDGALRKPGGGFFGPEGKRFDWGEREGHAYTNFGSAAGAGRLLKLDRDKMTHALGIAGHLCQVLTHVRYTFGDQRPMTKYGVPGWQNTGAINAVLLAEMGYIGDTTIFDSEHGFWRFCGYDYWDPDGITADLGKKWIFTSVTYKPYPCCRMIHGAIDCLYSIIDDNNLIPEEIESIKAYCHPTVEQPCFTNPAIENIVGAQFNPKYVLSVVAHRVRIGVEWQEVETMKDPKILKFMEKVTCVGHPEHGKQFLKDPTISLNKVEVVARGKIFTEERKQVRGTSGTEFAMTREELVDKFRHNASRILTQQKIDSAVNSLLNLEKLANISELMKQLTL
jgi:2-methylcitrate dehydratase PrpD